MSGAVPEQNSIVVPETSSVVVPEPISIVVPEPSRPEIRIAPWAKDPKHPLQDDSLLQEQNQIKSDEQQEQSSKLTKEHSMELTKEQSSKLTKEHSMELTKEHSMELTKEHSMELTKEHSMELTKEHSMELTKEHSMELTKEHSIELTKEQEQTSKTKQKPSCTTIILTNEVGVPIITEEEKVEFHDIPLKTQLEVSEEQNRKLQISLATKEARIDLLQTKITNIRSDSSSKDAKIRTLKQDNVNMQHHIQSLQNQSRNDALGYAEYLLRTEPWRLHHRLADMDYYYQGALDEQWRKHTVEVGSLKAQLQEQLRPRDRVFYAPPVKKAKKRACQKLGQEQVVNSPGINNVPVKKQMKLEEEERTGNETEPEKLNSRTGKPAAVTKLSREN